MTSTTRTSPRVRPSLGVALAIVVVYMAILVVLQIVSGVDFDEIAASTENVLRLVVMPVGIGSVLLFATWRYLGWGRPVIAEVESHGSLGVWAWIPPVLVAIVAVIGLTQADWGTLDMSFILTVVIGTLLVGFSEELLTRGLLLHAARKSLSTEFQVALLTAVVFGLVHGVNIFTGQAVGPTLQQVLSAMVSGIAFYLTRRLAGTLVAAMLLHAFYDAALFLQGEVQAPADGAGGTGQLTQVLSLVLQISVVVALVMLWRKSRSEKNTAVA